LDEETIERVAARMRRVAECYKKVEINERLRIAVRRRETGAEPVFFVAEPDADES
jgi:hypothetical protein